MMQYETQGAYGAPPSSMGHERQLFAAQGILVTSARFVLNQQTYPIAGITSVAPFQVNPSRGGPILLCFLASGGILGGISSIGSGAGMLLVSLILLVLGVVWFRSRKMQYGVMVATAGLQQRALVTTDGPLVHGIIGALNQAIAMR